MKKNIYGFGTLLFFAFLLSNNVSAAMINGSLKSADSATRKLALTTTDAVSGAPITVEVWVNAGAVMSGVADLSELKPGDQVWVEADTDSEGNLRARTLTKD